MAGSIIRVIPPRLLDFSAVSSGSSQEIVLADRIDISAWRQVGLLIRTHSNSIDGGEIDINAYADTRAEEDPGILFTGPMVAASFAGGASNYRMTNLDSSIGSMVKVAAKGTRSSSGSIAAIVSVDLSCKTT